MRSIHTSTFGQLQAASPFRHPPLRCLCCAIFLLLSDIYIYIADMSSCCVWVLMVVSAVLNQVVFAEAEVIESMPSLGINGGKQHATAFLLALQEGPAGAEHLQEWVTFVQSSTTELPPVWVVCVENSRNSALVQDLASDFQAFIVEENTSWKHILGNFTRQVRQMTNG